jgi:NADP-reducing hydrogenase subunit HndB
MKTVADLKALREKLQSEMQVRSDSGTKVVVGMGTCGIAAGAREVMAALLDEIAKRKLQDVHVEQTGCIGMCEKEVLVDVIRPGEDRITYGKVKPSDAVRIIGDHVVNGKIVQELVVGRIERQKK